jgi:hypothetical protein
MGLKTVVLSKNTFMPKDKINFLIVQSQQNKKVFQYL